MIAGLFVGMGLTSVSVMRLHIDRQVSVGGMKFLKITTRLRPRNYPAAYKDGFRPDAAFIVIDGAL
jgi:hypothetical protein